MSVILLMVVVNKTVSTLMVPIAVHVKVAMDTCWTTMTEIVQVHNFKTLYRVFTKLYMMLLLN